MRSLELTAKSGNWRLFTLRKNEEGFKGFSLKVLQRDNYTCQFCGFQAREYQEVVNIDNDYFNNKMSNMATACVFCTQCFFLDSVGIGDDGGGTIIYLPEIDQGTIHSMCHVLFCAITNNTGYKATAQGIYRSLKFRAQLVEEQFGEGVSQPSALGQLLIESADFKPEQREAILKDLRLLPSRAKFRKQIERWARSALEELSDED